MFLRGTRSSHATFNMELVAYKAKFRTPADPFAVKKGLLENVSKYRSSVLCWIDSLSLPFCFPPTSARVGAPMTCKWNVICNRGQKCASVSPSRPPCDMCARVAREACSGRIRNPQCDARNEYTRSGFILPIRAAAQIMHPDVKA